MKKANSMLLVAYHFPPVGGLGAAGSQRMHKFAKHLPKFGWQPVVLTVKEAAYEDYLKIDPTLLKEVSPELPIVRTGVLRFLTPLLELKNRLLRREKDVGAAEASAPPAAAGGDPVKPSRLQRFKDSITDLFEIPDEVSGWILPALYAGVRAIRRHDIAVVMATGRPWTTLVIGAALARLTGRILVVDFRDPWMTNPFRIPHSALKNRVERGLEGWVIRAADLIVANTDMLREEFVERFGADTAARCVTVLNGFDAAEFAAVVPEQREAGREDAFVMLHSGFLYGKRDPKSLIDAIGLLFERGAVTPASFSCQLIGSIELPYDLREYVRERGLQDLIHLKGEVSYADSIAAVAACDTALLLQPGTTTQIPSKVFEYIGLGKRMLTIAPAASSVSALVEGNDLGCVAEPDDAAGIADAIEREIAAKEMAGTDSPIDPGIQARFNVENSVRVLADAIGQLPGQSRSQ